MPQSKQARAQAPCVSAHLPDFNPWLMEKLPNTISKATFIDRWLLRRIEEAAQINMKLEQRLAALSQVEQRLLKVTEAIWQPLTANLAQAQADARQLAQRVQELDDRSSSIENKCRQMWDEAAHQISARFAAESQTIAGELTAQVAAGRQSLEQLSQLAQRLEAQVVTTEAQCQQRLEQCVRDCAQRAEAVYQGTSQALQRDVQEITGRAGADAQLIKQSLLSGMERSREQAQEDAASVQQTLARTLDESKSAAGEITVLLQRKVDESTTAARQAADAAAQAVQAAVAQAQAQTRSLSQAACQAMDHQLAECESRLTSSCQTAADGLASRVQHVEQMLSKRSKLLGVRLESAVAEFHRLAEVTVAAVKDSTQRQVAAVAQDATVAVELVLGRLNALRDLLAEQVRQSLTQVDQEMQRQLAQLSLPGQGPVDTVAQRLDAASEKLQQAIPRPLRSQPAGTHAAPLAVTVAHSPFTPAA